MLACVPCDIPLELFATAPPIVQAVSDAGSGPSLRPCRRRRGFTARTAGPRLHPHADSVVEHLNVAELATRIDEDTARARLP